MYSKFNGQDKAALRDLPDEIKTEIADGLLEKNTGNLGQATRHVLVSGILVGEETTVHSNTSERPFTVNGRYPDKCNEEQRDITKLNRVNRDINRNYR